MKNYTFENTTMKLKYLIEKVYLQQIRHKAIDQTLIKHVQKFYFST